MSGSAFPRTFIGCIAMARCRQNPTQGGFYMSEFVLLYRSTSEQHREAMGSPEKAQHSMTKWRAWMKDLQDKGHLKNFGQPLERVGKGGGGKKKAITPRPSSGTNAVICGSSLRQARRLAQATPAA